MLAHGLKGEEMSKLPPKPTTAAIIDRGRGPEIAGTRITVYDILTYSREGWHHTAIAAELNLSSDQVLVALRYIEEHKEEVMAQYQASLDRCARGNPPEVQAKLDAIHARYQVLWADRLRRAGLLEEDKRDGHSG
jgi:uncharacterized protein (DUF433 family)